MFRKFSEYCEGIRVVEYLAKRKLQSNQIKPVSGIFKEPTESSNDMSILNQYMTINLRPVAKMFTCSY